MTGKVTIVIVGLAFLMAGPAWAEPECSPKQHGRRDCPRSEYCILHYWAPTVYQVRACIRPSYLDEYPPGPAEPVPASVEFTRHRCRTAPSSPTSPYADPASYYGRPLAPP
jgi:hypothetical protein